MPDDKNGVMYKVWTDTSAGRTTVYVPVDEAADDATRDLAFLRELYRMGGLPDVGTAVSWSELAGGASGKFSVKIDFTPIFSRVQPGFSPPLMLGTMTETAAEWRRRSLLRILGREDPSSHSP